MKGRAGILLAVVTALACACGDSTPPAPGDAAEPAEPPALAPVNLPIPTRVWSGVGWTARLPYRWRAPADGREGYVEAPDRTAGLYFMTVDTPPGKLRELMTISADHLPEGETRWKVLDRSERTVGDEIHMSCEMYDHEAHYLMRTWAIGKGDRFVCFTFHDYDCADPRHSVHRPEVWLPTLELVDE